MTDLPAPPGGHRVEALLSGRRSLRSLSFESGARAVACEDQLELISSEGRLIACFDAKTGALVLHSASDLTLLSAGKLKLRGAETITKILCCTMCMISNWLPSQSIGDMSASASDASPV